MSNNVIGRSYYSLKCINVLPLSIGGTNSYLSDKDVIIGSNGNPLIPASSVAGALRNMSDKLFGSEITNLIFGCTNGQVSNQSRLIIEDAEIDLPSHQIEVRNFVKLEERVAKDGALFNQQYIPTGQIFTIHLELAEYSDDEKLDAYLKQLIASLKNRQLYLGGKKNRGFGLIEVLDLKTRSFNITDKNDYLEWLDFDLSDLESEISVVIEDGSSIYESFTLSLLQTSPFTIKSKVLISDENVASSPSCVGDMVVIPGSSIAGSFKAHLEEFLGVEKDVIEALFGSEKSTDKAGKQSEVIFHDVYLKKNFKKQSRNKIDRFTGGTMPTGLFTDHIQRPTDKLVDIEIRLRGKKYLDVFRKYLSSYIDSINMGFTTFGSNHSVGMGRFKAVALNEEVIQ